MLVAEAMNRCIVAVRPDARVSEAAVVAERAGTAHLLVLDEDNLVGILCTCDLRAAEPEAFVWECMSLPVITVRPDATVEEAAMTVSECEVGCLPVTVGGLLLGTVSDVELERAGVLPAGALRHHRHDHAAGGARPASLL